MKTIFVALAPQAATLRTAADEITIWLGINVGIHNFGFYEITSDNKNIYLHNYTTIQHVFGRLTVTTDLCVTVTRMPCLQRGKQLLVTRGTMSRVALVCQAGRHLQTSLQARSLRLLASTSSTLLRGHQPPCPMVQSVR